jgi:hypothetical protein
MGSEACSASSGLKAKSDGPATIGGGTAIALIIGKRSMKSRGKKVNDRERRSFRKRKEKYFLTYWCQLMHAFLLEEPHRPRMP